MKRQPAKMLTSWLPEGRRVRAACLAGALGLLIHQLVNTGFSTALWAAPPGGSAKRPVSPSADTDSRARAAQNYGRLPLTFEPNHGQTDPQVRFLSRGRGYTLFLTGSETVLSLKKPSAAGKSKLENGNSKIASQNPNPEPRTPEVLRMKLLGASPAMEFEGQDKLPGISNYFIGKDASKWRTNIPHYRGVVAKQVYPGVDLVYYGHGRQLDYDFIVAQGADPQAIRFALDTENRKAKNENRQTSGNPESRIPNPDNLRIDANGDLVVALDAGEVRFHKPLVYQNKLAVGSRQLAAGTNRQSQIGNRQLIEGRYVLLAENHVGFEVGPYDRTRPLVIDPVLSYSTYLGGIEIDAANAIAVSSDGSAFIAGETDSADFPTAHPLQPNVGGPFEFPNDAFVAKISHDGSTLFYSTFLGGSLQDRANGIAVDTFGNAYVTGTTISQDYPGSIGAADPNCGNDGRCDATTNDGLLLSDAFATKLNPLGSALVYSTFISHLGPPVLDNNGDPVLDDRGLPTFFGANDLGFDIAVGLNGSAHVVGTTDVGAGPFAGLGQDAFLVKISASGATFLYFGDFGGISEDQPFGVALDSLENTYLTGVTYSANFPGCALAGDADAFLMRIDTTQAVAGSILGSTCLGGSSRDQGNGLAVDAANNAYVAGVTNSADFPTTGGVVKPGCTAEGDVFVSKFNTTPALVYSTCVGGSGGDSGAAIALDAATNAYVTGFTNSAVDFPVPGIPPTSFQEVYGGGNTDAFIFQLNTTATALTYASFLGGSNAEDGRGIAVDVNGNAYVTGQTCSTDFPTVRPLQEFPGGNCDAFVVKVQVGPGFALSASTLNFGPQAVGTTSQPQTVTLSSKGDTPVTITSVSGSGDFSVSEDCTTLSPLAVDATCDIDVTFSPTTLDPKSGTITIVSNSLSSPDVVSLAGGGSNAAGGFLLSADPTSQIVNAGTNAAFTLSMTPTAGFSGNVNLACSGLPSQATCTISPATLTTAGTGTETAMLTVRTTARVMAPPAPMPENPLPGPDLRWAPWLAALMLAAMVATAGRKRAVLALAAMMLTVMLWTACGGGGTTVGTPRGTPAGNYTVTVTATSGTTSRTVAVLVQVN